ncbi:hypothetical protein TYRP_006999 [Tyrophagus putrescentiae]|nr:hypothetical protein TYRP_006999 [Tyrophagus putrescentiae]
MACARRSRHWLPQPAILFSWIALIIIILCVLFSLSHRLSRSQDSSLSDKCTNLSASVWSGLHHPLALSSFSPTAPARLMAVQIIIIILFAIII